MSHFTRVLRWLEAVILIAGGVAVAKFGYDRLQFIWFIPGALLSAVGGGLIFKDLLRLAARPFIFVIESIVFPIIPAGKPAPNYLLAQYYLREDLLEEAEIEYRTILKNHGREKRAYLELMSLLAGQGRFRAAKRVFSRGKRKLRSNSGDATDLEMHWHRLTQLRQAFTSTA